MTALSPYDTFTDSQILRARFVIASLHLRNILQQPLEAPALEPSKPTGVRQGNKVPQSLPMGRTLAMAREDQLDLGSQGCLRT